VATNKPDPKNIVTLTKKLNRRSLLKKAAIGAPIALTLMHKPAFGAICSISGFQSVNPSGITQTTGKGCGGYSPGGWRQNGYKTGSQDGNRYQWLDAGFNPNPRKSHKDPSSDYYDGAGTLFYSSSAFEGTQPSAGVFIQASDTLHDVLEKYSGSLEFHAIANLLNAKYFVDYRLHASDVVGLYDAYNRGYASYTSVNGTVVNLNNIALNGGLKAFFDQYH
jgi:hypothetical protein